MSYERELKKVEVFRTLNNTTQIINYDAANELLNSFLTVFSIWARPGQFCYQRKLGADGSHFEVWIEADADFFYLAQSEGMRRAIQWYGVELIVLK